LVAHALGILLADRLAAVMLRMKRMTARFLAGGLRRFEDRVFGERARRSAAVRLWPGIVSLRVV
jgi:hypothetical protein